MTKPPSDGANLGRDSRYCSEPTGRISTKSIARPGTNVTGTWVSGDEGLVGKRLGLLKDVVPGPTGGKRPYDFLHGDKTPGSRCFKRPPLDYRYFARFKAGPVGRSRL